MVTKEDVKNSMDCVLIKKSRKSMAICFVIFELLIYVLIVPQYSGNIKEGFAFATVPAVIFAVIMVSPLIYCYCKYNSIVKNYKNYDVYEVLLDKPHKSIRDRFSYYYTITFITKDNKVVTRNTKVYWSDGPFAIYSKRDYHNQKVKIFYDEKKDKVYVLGKVKG